MYVKSFYTDKEQDTELVPEQLYDLFNGEECELSFSLPDFSKCTDSEQRLEVIRKMHRVILDYYFRTEKELEAYASSIMEMQNEAGFVFLPAFGPVVSLDEFGAEANEAEQEKETFLSQILPTWLATAYLIRHYCGMEKSDKSHEIQQAYRKGLQASLKTPLFGWKGFVNKGHLLSLKVFLDGDLLDLMYEDLESALPMQKELLDIMVFPYTFPEVILERCAASEEEEEMILGTIQEICRISDQSSSKNKWGLQPFGVYGDFKEGGRYHDFVKNARYYRKGLTRETAVDKATGLMKNAFHTDGLVEFDIYLLPADRLNQIREYFESNHLGKMFYEQSEYADDEGTCFDCHLIFGPDEIAAADRPELKSRSNV